MALDPSIPAETRADELLTRLRALANPTNVAGMAKFGINPAGTLGVSVARLREIDKDFKTLRRSQPDYVHDVAAALWSSGIHEARILAGIMDVPALVTREQAERWVADFDSWDVCDEVCSLFGKTVFAAELPAAWTARRAEFVKRAGFVIVCARAVHDKRAPDAEIIAYLPLVSREATDSRPYVKRGVNWALRQVGKRSALCREAAVDTAESILAAHPDSPTARWIARDALRELRSPAVERRLQRSRA